MWPIIPIISKVGENSNNVVKVEQFIHEYKYPGKLGNRIYVNGKSWIYVSLTQLFMNMQVARTRNTSQPMNLCI